MMQGFDVDEVKLLRGSLDSHLERLNALLQQQPALQATDPELASASEEAAAGYRRLLSALGHELSDAETDQVAMDLRTLGVDMQHRMLGAVNKAERVEARRKKHADGWPSEPLPQHWCLPFIVVWRMLRFFLFTFFIDVSALLGFPVFLGRLRLTLVSIYSIMAISFVLHWFGMPHEDSPSSPAAAPAAAPALSALATACCSWQGIALLGTACVAVVALVFEKDLTTRASAVRELRCVARDAAKVPAKLPHPQLPSMRKALKDWADFCNATHQRDSTRLQQIEDNLVAWKWYPMRLVGRRLRTLWRTARGCFA